MPTVPPPASFPLATETRLPAEVLGQETRFRADPTQKVVVEVPPPAPWVPLNDNAQAVHDALEALRHEDRSVTRTIKLVYLTDWDAFDDAWREFLSRYPESDPVVGFVRAEISKLS